MMSTPEEAEELIQALLAGQRLQRSGGGGDPYGGWDTWSEELVYDTTTRTFVLVSEETLYCCAPQTTRTELTADEIPELIAAKFNKTHLRRLETSWACGPPSRRERPWDVHSSGLRGQALG